MRRSAVRQTLGELSRFAGAGLLNTLLTLAAYQALLLVMPPGLAYAAAWLVGICFVAIFYPGFVFRRPDSGPRQRLGTVAIYSVSFGLGLAIVELSHRHLGLARLSVFLALAATLVFNFAAMKLYLNPRGNVPLE